MPRIGVFPAAGALGLSITNHLLKLIPASQLVLIARKPESLSREANAGATIRHADYDDPSTLDHAFDGVDVLMLISYASFEIEYRVNVSTRSLHVFLILFLVRKGGKVNDDNGRRTRKRSSPPKKAA
jgi:uncharacterized protein YbjT (DUF2867 family)